MKGDNWDHELTLIRLPAGRIWTDPESQPEPFSGEVVPVEAKEAVDEFEPGPTTNQSDVNRNKSGMDDSEFELPDLLPHGPNGRTTRSVEFDDDAGHESGSTSKEGNTKSTVTDDSGRQFLDWLRENIRTGQLTVDAPGSRIYSVPEGLFLVSPAIFKDFVDRAGSELNWEYVQKRFLKLGIHTKTPDGLNVHKHTVNGVSLHGIVLSGLEFSPRSRSELFITLGD